MNLYQKAMELLNHARPFAFATVVKSSGSTPQKAGAQAIFEPGGAIWGTLGGGCLEAEARRRALLALDEHCPCVFDLSLDDDYGWDDGLICGGKVRIFVDPDVRKNAAAYQSALEAIARRERGVLVTALGNADQLSGQVRWLTETSLNGECTSLNPALLLECMMDEKPRLIRQEIELYVEPIIPSPRLIIAGAGHVGQATARLAAQVGFDVTVLDDRTSLTDPALYPNGVRTICGDIAAEATARLAPDSYLVIVTRGHRHDADVLAACVNLPARYLGLIGSRRKILLLRKRFLEDGVCDEAHFERVFSPIGLDIGSLTVEEIAVSIVGQLISVRRNHTVPGVAPSNSLDCAEESNLGGRDSISNLKSQISDLNCAEEPNLEVPQPCSFDCAIPELPSRSAP
ncbi:MAG: XdhC family protein [Candidatus Hydrogenedentes bacterium]|nr:XdhC family protein [Candidatus Hydrogenedentota bacterium]